MKPKIKDTLIIILAIILIIVLWHVFVYGAGMLFAYVWINLETPVYEIEFCANKVIENEDKEKIIEILKLDYVPKSFNVVKVRYNRSLDGDDGYDIVFEIAFNDKEEFEKNNTERASNVFEINKTTENDNCFYEYRYGSYGIDENYKIILKMIAKYD